MVEQILKNWKGLSPTFGTTYETEKDRAKRELMEAMAPLNTGDTVLVVDPEADTQPLEP